LHSRKYICVRHSVFPREISSFKPQKKQQNKTKQKKSKNKNKKAKKGLDIWILSAIKTVSEKLVE